MSHGPTATPASAPTRRWPFEWWHSPRGMWLRKQVLERGRVFLIAITLLNAAFVFLYPLLFLISTALKTPEDLADPTIAWVPTMLEWSNFTWAFELMDYATVGSRSTLLALAAAVGQVISCALIGYGFARYQFRGRDLLFGLIIFTFLVPPQTIIIPLFVLYRKLGWLNSYLPFVVPAFFGQGLRGALFTIIFRQFFRGLPWELEEAGRIDGAGGLTIFTRIMLPLAKPVSAVVFLFSLVWHWNNFFEPSIFLQKPTLATLPLKLSALHQLASPEAQANTGFILTENILMAAALMVVLPPIILYLFTQRYFVQSAERSGLTGQ